MSAYLFEQDFLAIGLANGFREVALPDAWALFASFDGTATDFFKSHREDKPHWYGAKVDNSAEHPEFYSIKAQGEHVKAHGEASCISLLATAGLKLGGTIKAPAEDADNVSNNPYHDDFLKTHTLEQREVRIASLIKSGGSALVNQLAFKAGKSVLGTPLKVTR
jgi:hypothetical protein